MNSLEATLRDLMYGLRTLRNNRIFASVAVLTLALGIGANTAIFSVIHAVLLKPLDYPDAGRLVSLGGSSPVRFELIKSSAHSYTGVAAFTLQEDLTLSGVGQPQVLKAARVSSNFLPVLGTVPLLGRGFLSEEDTAGGPAVAMISAELWQRRFGGDTHILGRTIVLGEAPYTIVGVLPSQFQFPYPALDVWLTQPTELPSMSAKSRALSPYLSLVGRLKPEVTLEQANAEMLIIQHQYAISYPAMLDAKPRNPVRVAPLKDQLVARIRSTLWILFGAVGFVLLIACANVASLVLARASVRAREFALRAALGASRSRLLAQLLAESVLLSLVGGAFGLLLAVFSLRAIRSTATFDLPRASEIHVDWMVLAFVVALSFVTGILFGLVPSLGASRPDIIASLRARGEAISAPMMQRVRIGLSARGLLVVAQVALSVVLLIGAALLIQSVMRLRGDNPGFNPGNLAIMRISLPPVRYDTDQKKNTFFHDLIEHVKSLPGVIGITAALSMPMTGYPGTPVQDASKPRLKLNERLIATMLVVTPGYFHTLEIPMRRGRDFNERDKQGSQRVAIIDENLAHRFWPAYPHGLDPVGQYLLIGGINSEPAQIVGIAGNVHQNVDNTAWPESVYVAFAQLPLPNAMLALRTEGDPLRYATTIRRQIQVLDPDQTVSDVRTMNDLIDAQLGQRRLLVMLLGFFASVALVLALVGIYGVIAYSVTQRTYEMGIRRALGAQNFDIVWLIVAQAFGLALTGTAIGIAGAFALTRVMKTLLFHVSATDPITFVCIALLFIFVAIGASYIPARRATRMDPMTAFRSE
jgi:putative ABC transport system permease protein